MARPGQGREVARQEAFQALGRLHDPDVHDSTDREEGVDVPVSALLGAEVPGDASPEAAEGRAAVDVAARGEGALAEAPDANPGRLVDLDRQRVGPAGGGR